ncbi:MAG: hypothetical protein KatS3mg027_2424 [Bacteroidia bacterium]|nr:MAG: hypothetical protein KatS3mg027_2424 [Bacteroidia bacterium]
MKTILFSCLFLLQVFHFTISLAQKSKTHTKSISRPLPHQDPDFHDDCVRYLYWYYVNYLDTIQHPIARQFFDNYGKLYQMESIFEPLRKWEVKYRPKLMCHALVNDYLRFLNNLDTLPADYANNKAKHNKKYYFDNNIHDDYSLFTLYSEPINTSLIKVGNIISYDRFFLYANMKDDEQLQYYPIEGHTAIITDILINDYKNQITLFVTLNKPGDVYALMLYDAKNDILVENLSPVILLFPYKHYMEKYFKYPFPSENQLPKNKTIIEITSFFKNNAIQPFLECSLNNVLITSIPNLYQLFNWYDKMKIPYITRKSYNKNFKLSKN